jgi:hypothetical protein
MSNGRLNPQQEFKNLLDQSNRALIAMGTNSTADTVAASLGLTRVLSKGDKNVTVVCSEELPVEAKKIVGWEKIAKNLEKNFVITLKSAVGNVEKVSYYTEGDNLNLVIHPRGEAPKFAKDQIEYKTGGTNFDLIFVLGSRQLVNLGSLYTGEESLYAGAPIINIDTDPANDQFGKINFVEPTASSISEIVVSVLKTTGISVDKEAASTFLAGIDWATNDFRSPQTSAGAFEAAAFCLKSGGKRRGVAPVSSPQVPPTPVETIQPHIVGALGEERKQELPTPAKPGADWLKPKIYKGGKLV